MAALGAALLTLSSIASSSAATRSSHVSVPDGLGLTVALARTAECSISSPHVVDLSPRALAVSCQSLAAPDEALLPTSADDPWDYVYDRCLVPAPSPPGGASAWARPALTGVAANTVSRLVPGVGRAGGHALARHMGLTDADLLERLSAQPGISGASSFTSRAVAESSFSGLLDSNGSATSSWLAVLGEKLVLDGSGGITGRYVAVLVRDAKKCPLVTGSRQPFRHHELSRTRTARPGLLESDWPDDYVNAWAAIDEYVASEPVARYLPDEIADLLDTTSSEECLRALVLGELGRGYLPVADGLTMRTWLLAVRQRVLEASNG